MDLSGLDAFVEEDDFWGVAVLRRGDEVLWSCARGLASRRWGAPITLETRFDVASISKLFTSVAVLQLVDRGLLDLDAPLSAAVDLSETPLPGGLTLRQLLLHTSGIGDIAEEDDGEDYATVFSTVAPHSVRSTRDFLPLFADKPANFPPGAGHRYCNAGYVLAALAVESAAGRGFREHVEAEVLAPAGMTRSAYLDKRHPDPDVAEGYDPDDDGRFVQNLYAYPPVGSGDGGAFSTAGDLLRFLDAVRDGVLLPDPLREAFLTPQLQVKEAWWQGLGLEFDDVSWWKEGCSEGASGCLGHYPAQVVDVAVLSPSMDGAWNLLKELDRRARG